MNWPTSDQSPVLLLEAPEIRNRSVADRGGPSSKTFDPRSILPIAHGASVRWCYATGRNDIAIDGNGSWFPRTVKADDSLPFCQVYALDKECRKRAEGIHFDFQESLRDDSQVRSPSGSETVPIEKMNVVLTRASSKGKS